MAFLKKITENRIANGAIDTLLMRQGLIMSISLYEINVNLWDVSGN